jgi:Uma2 family endonuclease
MELLIEEEKYTVEDFRKMENLDEKYYYELIEGKVVKKNTPNLVHHRVSKRLLVGLQNYLTNKKIGELLFAPLDVHFNDFNVFQPNLFFVSDSNKHILTNEGLVKGVPDLVIEIISPDSTIYDKGKKMKVYKFHKVSEYWIIDPKSQVIEIYVYRNEDYYLDGYVEDKGNLISSIFPELNLKAENIFADL